MSTGHIGGPRIKRPTRLSARLSLWAIIVAYLGLMLAASAPSSLYVVYRAEWHFSAITLTSIFAVYALALLLTLLTVGGLSDFIGRKPVLLASFTLLAASVIVFAFADGVAWLYTARVLQGLAAGSSIGALSAGIIDFAGPERRGFATLVNSLVPPAGLALGALGAGGLVQFAPAPTKLVFFLLAALFVVVLVAVAAGPETERRQAGALRSLAPRMRVPKRIRREFIGTVPGILASWAQFGLTLSLTTTVAAVKFGITDRFLEAVVVTATFASAALAAVLLRNASARLGTLLGSAALVGGGSVTLVSLAGPWAIAFYAGSAISGFGVGAIIGAGMRTLSPLPAQSERGEFFASVYVVGYLALSLPAVIAGVVIVHTSLIPTVVGYGIGIIVLATVAAASVFALAGRDSGANSAGAGRADRVSPEKTLTSVR